MTRLKVFLAVVVWGASFAFTKRALLEVSPLALVLARCALGSLVMLAAIRAPLFRGLRRREWLELAGMSLCGVAGQQLIQAFALRQTSANHAGWILAATPLVVAAFMAVFFGEVLGGRRWSGFVVGAAGTVLVVLSRQVVAGLGLIPTGRGDALFMTSCFNWALYVVMVDRWLAGRPQRMVTAMSMLLAFGMLCPVCLVGGQWRELLHVSLKGWLCLGYLGVLSSGLGYLFYNEGTEKLGASAASVFLYLEPLAALTAGRLMLGEEVAPGAVLGGLLILAGVYWVNAGRPLPAAPEEAA